MEITSVSLVAGDAPRARVLVGTENPEWDIGIDAEIRGGRPVVTHLDVRPRAGHVTSVELRTLPLRVLTEVAAAALRLDVEEAAMRALVRPRPPGTRSWPESHYASVLRVAEWARRVGRPGGGRGAVAEYWGVTVPTVEVWLRKARQARAGGGDRG